MSTLKNMDLQSPIVEAIPIQANNILQPSAPLARVPVQQQSTQLQLSKFDQLIKQRELNPIVRSQLLEVFPNKCNKIILLCDDSDSMSLPIAEEGIDPFAPKRSTRWLELKKLVAVLVEFVISINPNGLDIHFLNRPSVTGITSVSGLQGVFSVPPTGGTPLITRLSDVMMSTHQEDNKIVLVIVITDGEPTDGSRDRLRQVLLNKPQFIHTSFAECTDNAEDMEYLDAFDGVVPGFDNTEDYREELNRVQMIQGMGFKFDYTDYVLKILLATFIRYYFNLDQSRVTQQCQTSNTQYLNTQSQVYQPQQTFSSQYTSQYQPNLPQSRQARQPQQVYAQPYQQNPVQTYGNDTACCIVS